MRFFSFKSNTPSFTAGQRAACLLFAALVCSPASAQVFDPAVSFSPADVEQLDAGSAAYLENAKRFLAEHQWSEAVEAIRRVQEAEPSRLVNVDLAQPVVGFERYVTAREYCQWRLASLATEAPEALAHYRRLVDALAESWLHQGEKDNDEAPLHRIIQQAFASRFGDDALLKLGDLALARGDYATARAAWQCINAALMVSPTISSELRAAAGSPLWLALRKFDFAQHGSELLPILHASRTSLPNVYPDSDLDPAGVHARLVLVSILEGSRERAQIELSLLRLLHPDAEAFLAGRRGRYADSLQSVLDEAAGWPAIRQRPDWPTFGGSPARAKTAAEIEVAGKPLWSYPLPRISADREWLGSGRLRVSDDAKSLLSYHPVVAGGRVILRTDALGNSYVVALDLKTGKQLWQVDFSRGIARQPSREPAGADKAATVSDVHSDLARHIGVARYTASVSANKLFVRMGSPVTMPSARRAALWLAKDQGFLLGLDLSTEGRPLEGFPIRPPSNEWTFEGTPLVSGGELYVAMRRVEGARSQLYLAAFELQTTPAGQADDLDENSRPAGRLKWRTRICSSTTLGGGETDQLTYLLVTLDGNRLYLNTSAGAVAAVNADDGRVLWLIKYPRASARSDNPDRPQHHWFRDLTPCLAWKDLVIVAPADCERIFALQAVTGQLAWTLAPGAADDAIHLLGAVDDTLVVSGDSLYWIDLASGRLMAQFPRGPVGGAEQAAPSPRGFGRGTIAGRHIWWPTRESIYVFDSQPIATDFGWQPRIIREIPLVPRGVTGGNLVLADGVLLIATGDKLIAFGGTAIQ
jgi:outer membrane protein assembly factor BamB/predicted negative regulator of RcsB-dependent stress response